MYYLLILVIGLERLAELVVSKRNAQWAFAQGGKETLAVSTIAATPSLKKAMTESGKASSLKKFESVNFG